VPNLDLVRSIYADWERGDFSRTDWAEPEIEFVVIGGPSPVSARGLRGMAAFAHDVLSLYEDYRNEAQEYRELDAERVLVLDHLSGRGKTSGVELEGFRAGAHLFHVRDGQVTRCAFYFDRDRAFADLGLAPEGDS
jgi:ketosteroid isomerase-like protein